MASDKAATRRRYDDELKAQVVAECDAAGASVVRPEQLVFRIATMRAAATWRQ
jgi:hypothetical protein